MSKIIHISYVKTGFLTRLVPLLALLILLPGLFTSAFAQPTITLILEDGEAAEATQDPGSFSVARSGDGDTAEALVVQLSVGGTALRDIDYARSGLDWPGGEALFVTIPAGELTRTVNITPYPDNELEAEETATFMLLELGDDYILGADTDATIMIENDDDRVFTNSFDRPNPMPPIDVGLSLSSEDGVSAIIGPEGGSLTTQSPDASTFELIIPAGSVQQPTTITMTPIITLLPGPFAESLGSSFTAGVHLQPDGLFFLQPLSLTVTPPGDIDASTWAWSYQEDGNSLQPVPFISNGSAVTIDVWHFSGTGISLNWSKAVQSFGNFAARTAEQIALHNIGNVVANPICDETGCYLDQAALINIFLNWYLSGVKPMLTNAKSNPDLAKPALNQWLSWLAEVQKWGLDDEGGALDNPIGEAENLAKRVIDAAFSAAITKCDGAGSKQEALADLAEPLDWITTAQMLSYDNEYPITEIEKCATIKVSDASYPPRLDNGESGELKIRVGVLFRGINGSTRYDLDANVMLTPDGIISAPSSGSPGNDGWFTSNLTMTGEGDATVKMNASVLLGTYQSEAEQSYTIKPKTSLSLQGKPVSGGAYSDTVEIEPNESADVQATVFFEAAPSSGKTVDFTLVEGPGSLTFTSVLTDGDGLASIQFQAPNEAGQSSITASHTTDTAKLLEDTITITYGASLTISPVAALVDAGGTVEFTATTTNLSPAKVTWSATAGTTIQSTGDLTATWTAPIDAGGYTITATSVANTSVKGAASATVELSAEPTGEFAEGLYYGRLLDRCEYESERNEYAGDCDERIARPNNAQPAWMRIHSDDGPTVVEFYTSGTVACGWDYRTQSWDICSTYYPHFVYRAWYDHLVLSVGTIGSTTALPPQGSIPDYRFCYISCLSSWNITGNYWSWGGVIRFGQDKVTVIERPDDAISAQRRWIFVKDEERDPFGEWAFDPLSLETPEEYRRSR